MFFLIAEMVTTTKAFMKARSAALRLHSASDTLLDADHVNGSVTPAPNDNFFLSSCTMRKF